MNDEAVQQAPPLPAAMPPPPPAIDPRPTRLQQQVLVAMAAAGLLVLLVAWLLAPAREARWLTQGGCFLCCYAALVSASWLRDGVLSRRLDRFLDGWVKSGAGGFYGMMALSVYVQLECRSAIEALAEFELAGTWWRSLLIEHLLGFSVQSIRNLVLAMIWPAVVFVRGASLGPMLMLAACWAVYAAGRRVLPQVTVRDASRRR